ncbi:MAG TPA: FAD-dependent oxidoreductase [Pyrinomonadaceae bacterium]|nr:FAD-dependent oxidoreductase [Pyrinomonadaceae bacterium]
MGAPKTCDVVVVGAGVFGAWTAYQLRQAGKSVTLIDGYGAGNSRSSSGDESRIIRMGYGADEIYSRSAWRSLQLWKEFFAQTGDNLFRETGVLWLAHEGDPYPVSTFETLTKLRFPVEKLTLPEVSTRYPQFGYEGIGGAFLEPESGVLLARRAVQAVVREALKSGVEYLQDSVEPANVRRFDEVVTTSGERISAAVYVFACGAWLPKVFPEVLAGRIHPTRQDVFYLGAPGMRFQSPALPVWIDFKTEAYGLPDIEGRGVKVAIDRHGEAFDPDTRDRVVSSESLAEVRRYLARRVPELQNAPVNETRVCQYENTSNGDFLIDRHPEFENVWLVGGGSGHGFKHGPFVGEYVAARIEGRVEGEPRFSLATKLDEHQRAVY